VDWPGDLGADGALLIDGLADNVDDSAEGLGADGDPDRIASVQHFLAADQALGGVERDGAHVAAAQVLRDLQNQTVAGALHLQRVEDGGQCAFELNIDDGADDLGDLPNKRCLRAEEP